MTAEKEERGISPTTSATTPMTNQRRLEKISSPDRPLSSRKAEANRRNVLKSTPWTIRGKP